MFEGIEFTGFGPLTDQQQRWLNNVKKAFHESDSAYVAGHPEDRCIEEFCKAIDTAKTLLRSLKGLDTSPVQNKERFIEFLSTELPSPEANGVNIQVTDFRTGDPVEYWFIRLMRIQFGESPGFSVRSTIRSGSRRRFASVF